MEGAHPFQDLRSAASFSRVTQRAAPRLSADASASAARIGAKWIDQTFGDNGRSGEGGVLPDRLSSRAHAATGRVARLGSTAPARNVGRSAQRAITIFPKCLPASK